MTKRKARRRDPMDRTIEAALQPGRFVPWSACSSFVSGLSLVEEEIGKLIASEPSRAAGLYETFIAGCNKKADEIDDSNGELGAFAGGLFCGWIKARQADGNDPDETARLLLAWMDDDPYGFCHGLEREAGSVLDRAGLEAFEREVRARCNAPSGKSESDRDYARRRWGQVLKTIYRERREIAKYIELIAKTGLTQADCEAIAAMFQAERKPKDALAWVERGLEVEKRGTFESTAGHRLAATRRALLAKLGRSQDALASAWAAFQECPATFTYEELLRYVPKIERAAWHEKAMEAAGEADLDSLIELWLSTKEIGRLIKRLDGASDAQLESLSHYTTGPAARRLARTHPAAAAKVFRAMGMRIINGSKSKYYDEALSNFKEARRCYEKAGLGEQ